MLEQHRSFITWSMLRTMRGSFYGQHITTYLCNISLPALSLSLSIILCHEYKDRIQSSRSSPPPDAAGVLVLHLSPHAITLHIYYKMISWVTGLLSVAPTLGLQTLGWASSGEWASLLLLAPVVHPGHHPPLAPTAWSPS